MSVNKCILVGRVGKDPEIRYMSNGEAVANLTLATSEKWKDKEGKQQEKTEWHNITAYRRLAEVLGEYVTKGSALYIEGKIQTRKWQDKDGNDRYTTEIIADKIDFLSAKKSDSTSGEARNNEPARESQSGPDFEDDITF